MSATKTPKKEINRVQMALIQRVHEDKMRQGALAELLKVNRRTAGCVRDGERELTLCEAEQLAAHYGLQLVLIAKECLGG